MDKKQTAVDWLIKSVNQELEKWSIGEITGYCYKQKVIELTLQAKQMEKEQLIDSYNDGYDIRDNMGSLITNPTGEQYYNEIYKP